MAEVELDVDSLIQRLLEGKHYYNFSSHIVNILFNRYIFYEGNCH